MSENYARIRIELQNGGSLSFGSVETLLHLFFEDEFFSESGVSNILTEALQDARSGEDVNAAICAVLAETPVEYLEMTSRDALEAESEYRLSEEVKAIPTIGEMKTLSVDVVEFEDGFLGYTVDDVLYEDQDIEHIYDMFGDFISCRKGLKYDFARRTLSVRKIDYRSEEERSIEVILDQEN